MTGTRGEKGFALHGFRKALSHDVDKELTGVAHSMLEGLAAGGELRRNGC